MCDFDPNLFTETLAFAGVFRDGELSTKPLSVEIRYSLLNAYPPVGVIRGTAADWPELEDFFNKRQSPLCELQTARAGGGLKNAHSSQVLIRKIGLLEDESEIVQQVLGRFDIFDITIDTDYGPRGQSNRKMTFLLTGPVFIWMSPAIRQFSNLRRTKTRFPSARLQIFGVRDVQITAQPHFLYAHPMQDDRNRTFGNTRLSVEAEAFALTLTDRDLDRTDASFAKRALEVVDILCLLVSFISKATVTWYSRTLWSDGRLSENYREVPQVPISRISWQEIVLYPRDVRSFISKAFTAYAKGNDGVNLRLPILIYVSAQSARTVDEQFILLFSCLEKVVDMLDQAKPWEVLKDSELRTIARFLRAQLKEMGKDFQTVATVSEKIKELARPAFRRRLSEHLRRLNIKLDDIGGHDKLRDIIRVRNSLIHRAEEVSIQQIVQDRKRLETIVERVLLTLLNWPGSTNTPTLANRPVREGS